MKWLVLALIVFGMLSIGCAPMRKVVLDPCVPHPVAEPSRITVECKGPDGRLYECRADLDRGWWVASPLVVEGPSPGCEK